MDAKEEGGSDVRGGRKSEGKVDFALHLVSQVLRQSDVNDNFCGPNTLMRTHKIPLACAPFICNTLTSKSQSSFGVPYFRLSLSALL